MMSRKDYNAIAKVLQNHGGWYATPDFKDLVEALADHMQADNPNFDRDRFEKACYGEK